jgi:hypothetical protein
MRVKHQSSPCVPLHYFEKRNQDQTYEPPPQNGTINAFWEHEFRKHAGSYSAYLASQKIEPSPLRKALHPQNGSGKENNAGQQAKAHTKRQLVNCFSPANHQHQLLNSTLAVPSIPAVSSLASKTSSRSKQTEAVILREKYLRDGISHPSPLKSESSATPEQQSRGLVHSKATVRSISLNFNALSIL